jgi:hypothetical protein
MAGHAEEYQGSCYCGSVKVTVTGSPRSSAICHCHSCRKWHAAPINAWSIWKTDDVSITGGPVITSSQNEASGRVTCEKCGGCVANHKPKVNMTVVYPMTLAGSGLKYEPACHIFYSERVMDFADGLPKFADMPEKMGGTGKRIEEPETTGWCE